MYNATIQILKTGREITREFSERERAVDWLVSFPGQYLGYLHDGTLGVYVGEKDFVDDLVNKPKGVTR